jgi:hypothetical protein
MPQPFASISASLLARKGEAKPSQEPAFGSKPWQPPVVPAQQPQPRPPVAPPPAAAASIPAAALTPAAMAPAEAKVKLSEVDSVWPTPPAKPSNTVEVDVSAWEPARPVQAATPVNPNTPIKTTIRLTHAQVRAVKLAALLLDRPQQEILTAGLLGRLEAIACSDLSACTCFKAVMEGLKAPDPLMEPPLPY